MTVYPPRVLDVLFTYQPPNDDTRPRHAAVAQARADYDAVLASVFDDLDRFDPLTDEDYVALHSRVSMAALAYAKAVNEACDDAGDMESHVASAVMSITVSRMWANKAIRAPAGGVRGRYVALAKTASEEAEMLANSAIALAEPVAEAYETLNG